MRPTSSQHDITNQPFADAISLCEFVVTHMASRIQAAYFTHGVLGKFGLFHLRAAPKSLWMQARPIPISPRSSVWTRMATVPYTACYALRVRLTAASLTFRIAAFSMPVRGIFRRGAFKKMRGVAADRIVARVTDAEVGSHLPVPHIESDAVSAQPPLTPVDGRSPYAVPVAIAKQFPRPALILVTLSDVGMKAVDLLRRQVGKDKIQVSHFSLLYRLKVRAVCGVSSTGAARLFVEPIIA